MISHRAIKTTGVTYHMKCSFWIHEKDQGSTLTFVTSGIMASKMVVLTSKRALSTSHEKFSS